MYDLRTLARPYAIAAFKQGKAENTLKHWETILGCYARACKRPETREFIRNPEHSVQQIVDALTVPDAKLDASQVRFLTLLAENQRLEVLGGIFDEFMQLQRQASNAIDVTLESAMPLDPEDENTLRQRLQRKLNKDIHLSIVINSSLIGGAIIRYDDTVIDGSVRGLLDRLKHTL